MAEDIASDTFLAALETWTFKGIPENPTAWLYVVAKNKARNAMQRDRVFAEKIAGKASLVNDPSAEIDIDWSDDNITDSQLKMLFAICHPTIPVEAQVGLSLRILCGFGIDEIADAFLTNKEVINKRLFRAREKLRVENIRIEFPQASEIRKRTDAVLTTLYLLFNEGYYSQSRDVVLREDLCLEAMRLVRLLIDHEHTNIPATRALLALMCFHASRFKARTDEHGGMVLYADQDDTLWDRELIARGVYYLHLAAQGTKLSKYHIEAAIAYWMTVRTESLEKWNSILQLYDQLLQLEYSPVAALNRTYAFSKIHGKMKAISEAEKLKLLDNRFYFMLLGELYTGINGDYAKKNFTEALSFAKNQAERRIIQARIDALAVDAGR
jgi:RNA polymerase sigma-70 factor (ECF subfamily)